MNTTTKQDYHVRWMIRRDLSSVEGIENAVFEYPWPEEDFLKVLRQRNCIGMVAEHKERVVGYMLYELHRDHIYVLNLAVHASMHRKGVGTAMIDKLKGKLNPQRKKRISLAVRETNMDACLFFKAMGFRATSVVRDYYTETSEDAILFQFRVKDTPGS